MQARSIFVEEQLPDGPEGGTMHPLAFFICSILFLYAGTYAESLGGGFGSGFAGLVQALSATLMLALLLMLHRTFITVTHFVVIASIMAVFLAANLRAFGFFPMFGALNILAGLMLAASAYSMRAPLYRILGFFLAFHIAGLALALFLFVLTGKIVDLHGLLIPWSESRAGVQFEQVRVTGFHIEPGNYANATYMVVLIRAMLRGRLRNRLDLVAMLSTLVTLSAWSVVGFSCWLLGAGIEMARHGSPWQRRFMLICAAALALLAVIGAALFATLSEVSAIQYLILRFSFNSVDQSSVQRVVTLEAWLSSFGAGWIFPKPLSTSFCEECMSPHDIGVGMNLIYYFGFVISFMMIFFWARNILKYWGISFLLASMAVVFSKSFYYEFLFWFCFSVPLLPATRRAEKPAASPSDISPFNSSANEA